MASESTDHSAHHCRTVGEAMYGYLKSAEFCDTVIYTTTDPVYAHALVLNSVNKQIPILLDKVSDGGESGMKFEVNMSSLGCNADVMNSLLKYCYTGVLGSIRENSLDDLYVAAKYLGIDAVSDIWLEYKQRIKHTPRGNRIIKFTSEKTKSSSPKKNTAVKRKPTYHPLKTIDSVLDMHHVTATDTLDADMGDGEEDVTSSPDIADVDTESNHGDAVETPNEVAEADHGYAERAGEDQDDDFTEGCDVDGENDDVDEENYDVDGENDDVDEENYDVDEQNDDVDEDKYDVDEQNYNEDYENDYVDNENDEDYDVKTNQIDVNMTKGLNKKRDKPYKPTTTKKSSTRRTVAKHRVGQIPCTECDRKFVTTSELNRHFAPEHRGERFKCEYCDKQFKYKTNYTSHVQSHTGNYLYYCEVCNEGFGRKFNLERHMKRKHRSGHVEPVANTNAMHPCTICGINFNRISNLRRHVHTQHTDVGTAISTMTKAEKVRGKRQVFPCSQCPKRFITQALLDRHYGPVHEGKKWKCERCDDEFTRKTYLNAHMQHHTGEYMYNCSECGKGFARKVHLDRHIGTTHKRKSVQCDRCGKGFDYKILLTNHQQTCGVLTNKFECKICHSFLKSHALLMNHMHVHDPTRATPCQYCGKMFKTKKHARIHENKVHPLSAVQCPLCQAVVKSEVYLKRHMQLHDPEQRTACTFCGKIFKGKLHARLHEKKIHGAVYRAKTHNKPMKIEKGVILQDARNIYSIAQVEDAGSSDATGHTAEYSDVTVQEVTQPGYSDVTVHEVKQPGYSDVTVHEVKQPGYSDVTVHEVKQDAGYSDVTVHEVKQDAGYADVGFPVDNQGYTVVGEEVYDGVTGPDGDLREIVFIVNSEDGQQTIYQTEPAGYAVGQT